MKELSQFHPAECLLMLAFLFINGGRIVWLLTRLPMSRVICDFMVTVVIDCDASLVMVLFQQGALSRGFDLEGDLSWPSRLKS